MIIALEKNAECEDMLVSTWRNEVAEENKRDTDKSEQRRVDSRRGYVAFIRQAQDGKFLGRTDSFFQCLPDTVDPRGPKK